jgi:MFS family permease
MLSRFFKLDAQLTNATLKHNFTANVMDGGLYAFAMSMISIQTVLPVFVKSVGGSNVAVGLIPVIWMAGLNFPQIFIAGYVNRFAYKKSLMLKTGLIQRLPWLLLAILTYFVIAEVPQTIGLAIFFTVLAIAAIGGSVNLPVWFELIAKITPVGVRGRMFALRTLLGALLGILGGWIVTIVLNNMAYPANYALLFTLAFILMMISFGYLTTLREEEGNKAKKVLRLREYVMQLPEILRHQKNYRNFLVADAAFISSVAALAFYTVFAVQKFSLGDEYAGKFTIVMMTAVIFGSMMLGSFADRSGHKLNLMLGSLAVAAGCGIALWAPVVEAYFLTFVLSALTIGITMISRLPFIAELCTEEERPTYVALTNLITSPFFLTGIIAGRIADVYGFEIVFIGAGVIALLSAGWMYFMVAEPRQGAVKHIN